MRKVLITGGTGFLGRHLSLKLVQLNYCVTALGRNAKVGRELMQSGVNFAQVDLLDQEKLNSWTNGNDFVFHCAALASPWGKYQDFHQSNVIGTQNVIEACKMAQIKRLIHVSSPSVYYDGRHQKQISESAKLPTKFANHYAKTKYLAELLVNQAYSSGLSTVTLRPRAMIGPYDTAIMPRVLRVMKKGWFPLFSKGESWIDLTCVENVVEALILCMNAGPEVDGKKYNITNGQPMMIRELVEQLSHDLKIRPRMVKIPYSIAYPIAGLLEALAVNHEPLITRYSVGLLGRSQTLDISAAKNELKYTPQKSIEEGLRDYAAWWIKSKEAS